MTTQADIDEARNRILADIRRLHEMIEQACPGPHMVIGYRDAKPPWCPRCGRTNDGALICERLGGDQ